VDSASRRIGTVLARGLRVRVSCSEACAASSQLVLPRGRVVAGRGSRRLARGESAEVLVRLTRRGRAALRRARRVAAEVRLSATDAAGNAARAATRVQLSR
jgi:hypothetical protein